MQGALIILAVLVIVGVILYLVELKARKKLGNNADTAGVEVSEDQVSGEESTAEEVSGECCGLHLVCEKDSLSPMSAEILYYDDEELDRFVGRDEKSYTPDEVEEFRDVLMTLRPEDVTGWARSVTQRGLPLPSEVRDELLILVNEQRGKI